ncbi:hypothetical protein SAMN06265348_11719 [Pedobacter westerhofensis]|uniref:Uncharacterized protein n=1 Tax=Pedobacter westerhofensis TaxID=425512 RepID=A0A521FSS7_9SPHI|nr:hypothetical protein [Pedobacter westerhofensis]SMO98580.1 hypothetical protein SAMN06265348_11719 [Pedobacter westerhofensis]
MEHLYYKPSGKIPVKGIFISIITAFVITVILSIIYIALQWFIPFIYLNFFIAAGLGFGVGAGVFIAIGLGKIRNTKYECVLAALCGLLAWYSQWALFVSLMSEAKGSMGGGMWVRSSFNLTGFWYILTNPEILFKAMLSLNDAGTFTLKHNTVSGTLLWLVWIIEAVIIIGAPMLFSLSGRSTSPFSEQNDQWMEERELEEKLKTVTDPDQMIAELNSGNLKSLKDFLPADDLSDDYATLRIYESPGDPVSYISVTNISHIADKKGELKKETKPVIEYFRITTALN